MSTKDLQETIANLQTEDGTRCCIISDHAARDLLAICDKAIILANKKIIAEGSPNDLMNNQNAKRIYFGDAFKLS
jgi:lipopolysaccharide export system ATP-binding protein